MSEKEEGRGGGGGDKRRWGHQKGGGSERREIKRAEAGSSEIANQPRVPHNITSCTSLA